MGEDLQCDPAPFLNGVDGVGEQIDKYLFQADRICIKIRVSVIKLQQQWNVVSQQLGKERILQVTGKFHRVDLADIQFVSVIKRRDIIEKDPHILQVIFYLVPEFKMLYFRMHFLDPLYRTVDIGQRIADLMRDLRQSHVVIVAKRGDQFLRIFIFCDQTFNFFLFFVCHHSITP